MLPNGFLVVAKQVGDIRNGHAAPQQDPREVCRNRYGAGGAGDRPKLSETGGEGGSLRGGFAAVRRRSPALGNLFSLWSLTGVLTIDGFQPVAPYCCL